MLTKIKQFINNFLIKKRKQRFISNHPGSSGIIKFRGCNFFAGLDRQNKIETALLSGKDNYDIDNFSVISAFVRPGSVCFDIGANIGVYTVVMGKISGDKGFVHSFEPVPHIRSKLLANVSVNSHKSLCINDFALGKEETSLEMFQVKDNQYRGGTSTFIPNENISSMGTDKFNKVSVKVTTIDSYCRNNDISNVDFIKIDVEGFERNVLSGGIEIITRHSPIILMEYDPIRHSNDREFFKSFFETHGYSIFEFSTFSGELIISPFNFSGCPNGRNILCFKH